MNGSSATRHPRTSQRLHIGAGVLFCLAGLVHAESPEGLEGVLPENLSPEFHAMMAASPKPTKSSGEQEIEFAKMMDGVPRIDFVSTELLGVVLSGEEKGTTQAFTFEGSYAIALSDFARFANVELEQSDGVIHASTPLGSIELRASDLVSYKGRLYLPPSTIKEKLVTDVGFKRQDFALELSVPWSLDDADLPIASEDALVDAEPPGAALSTIRVHSSTTHVEGSDTKINATAELAGRLADGWWSTRVRTNDLGDLRLDDWAWVRELGKRSRTLIGHQRVNLHSLFNGIEMSGIQAAYTNQPLDVFERSTQPRQLLSRRIQARSAVQGYGPPAGLAELRVDGRIIARQIIRLDGSYEFFDLFLPSRQLTEVEVYLYDRNNLAVPVSIVDETRNTSEFLMPGGAFFHQGGLGVDGNLASNNEKYSDTVGFYQWRHGLSDRFTMEAGVQSTRDNRQVMAGFVSSLPFGFVMSAGVGGSDNGSMGYDASVDRYSRRFRLRGQMNFQEAGFRAPVSEELSRHSLDLTYIFPKVQVGLTGRYQEDSRGLVEYVLPNLAWVPNTRFSFRANPDRFGDYRYDMTYRYRRASRLALRYQDSLAVDLTHRLGRQSYLSLGTQLGDETTPDTHHASLTWTTDGRLRPTFTVGATSADDRIGYRATAVARMGPGIHAQLSVDDTIEVAHERGPFNSGLRVTGTITADLALAGNRLIPVHSTMIHQDRGGVAGRVFSTLGGSRRNLRDLVIFLDGAPAARTNEDGEFFIGNLSEGVFRIELGEENLPIELSADGTVRRVRVAAAAVTRIDFSVTPEFGFSGRISDLDNLPLTEVKVEVLTESGFSLQSTFTDRFGLYRFDGLPPGRYELRLESSFARRFGMPMTSRWIDLDDGFLFDQNLLIPTRSQGHIRGRVVAEVPDGYDAYLLLNGQRVSKAHRDGEFYIGGLDPGNYRVSLAIEEPGTKVLRAISHEWTASVRGDQGTRVDVTSRQEMVLSSLRPKTLHALASMLSAGP